jgi:hypothetical protein
LVGSLFGVDADQADSFDEGDLIEMDDEPHPLALSSLDCDLDLASSQSISVEAKLVDGGEKQA